MRLTCATCRRKANAAHTYTSLLDGTYVRVDPPWRFDRVWIKTHIGGYMAEAAFCSDICEWRFDADVSDL